MTTDETGARGARDARGLEALTHQSYPRLSDEAAQHLALLLQHRPDEAELVARVYPERCERCRELADWSAAIVDIAERRRRDG